MTREELEKRWDDERRFKRGGELLDEITFLNHVLYMLIELPEKKEFRRNLQTIKFSACISGASSEISDASGDVFWKGTIDQTKGFEPLIEMFRNYLNDRITFLNKQFEEL